MRPNPYTTSGRPGRLASGVGRPEPDVPCRRWPGPEAGMTVATGRAVMTSWAGGSCAARSRGGREDQPPGACSSAGRFGKSHQFRVRGRS
jgi:hypothetical protein